MALSEAEQAKAETIVKGFFWQPGEIHRYRTLYFTEGASMQPDEIRLVREYLLGLGSLASLNVCGKLQEFPAAMKVLDVWWQTNPGDKWAGTESTKVRIYLALRPRHGENDADGPYTVENGCKYLVTHTFYWDVEALPTLPESSSGVNYTMQGVTRDRETGLFACVIERRETVQQDVAEYTKAETEFEREQEEQHLGVKESAVAATGSQAGAADGVITMREVRKNPDCTSDVINRKRTELASQGATKEYHGDPRGTIETTIDRNQQFTVNGDNLANGETRRSEKTEGKRYNNTRRVPTPKDATIVETEQVQKHVSTSGRLTAHRTKPSSSAGAAQVNRERRVSVRPNELGGFDKEETTIEHQPATTGPLSGGSTDEQTIVEIGINQPQVPAANPEVNVTEEVSAQPNEMGSFSVHKRRVLHKKRTVTAVSKLPTLITTEKVTINDTAQPEAQQGDASASPNNHGSQTTRIVERMPRPCDSGWITWTSEEKLVRGKYTYENGLRIFLHLPSVPSLGGNHNYHISASIDQFGLYGGTITYKDLKQWSLNDGGNNNGGGSVGGTIRMKMWDPETSTWKQMIVSTRAYWGNGNEGSEASAKANQVFVPGLHLPSRTYATAVQEVAASDIDEGE